MGTLHLNTFDVAALWNRPKLLTLSGDGKLAGSDWGHLSATLAGDLNDASGELSGPLSASYSAGDVALTLDGRKLKATATLKGNDYRAALSSSGAALARLLPPSAGVNALTLSGSVSAEGSLSDGVQQVAATSLNIRGQQTQFGIFTLLGSAQYSPQENSKVAGGTLSGTLLGGSFDLGGTLPAGISVNLRNLKPTAFGLDTLAGTVNLSGDLLDPQLRGRVTVSRPEVTAGVNLSGSVREPVLNAAADLKGDYSGRLLADVRHLRLSPLQADLHVYGSAAQRGSVSKNGQASTSLKVDVTGQWPKLSGTVKATVASLPAPLTLVGDGKGRYALDAGALGSGSVTLALPATGGLLPDVNASARLTPLPLLPGAKGDGSLDVAVSGPVSALSVSAQGRFPSVEVSGVSLQNLGLSAAGALTGPHAGLSALTGSVTQDGKTIGTLKDSNLNFSALVVQGYGFDASATGRATLSGTASATVHLSGAGTSADLKAAYAERQRGPERHGSGLGLHGGPEQHRQREERLDRHPRRQRRASRRGHGSGPLRAVGGAGPAAAERRRGTGRRGRAGGGESAFGAAPAGRWPRRESQRRAEPRSGQIAVGRAGQLRPPRSELQRQTVGRGGRPAGGSECQARQLDSQRHGLESGRRPERQRRARRRAECAGTAPRSA